MEQIDLAVIGAGVIGLASAWAAARHGMSVCVLEREARPGLGTSSRNSQVIHAGLYYPAGSLKARLCVEGAALLYRFCEEHGVPHDRCGKLIVAVSDDETPVLEQLRQRGTANGVAGLTLLDRGAIRDREPHVDAVAALYSPTTGIVDAEALIRALTRACERAGVAMLPATPVAGADSDAAGIRLTTPREVIHARAVVNAAGLFADQVSTLLGGTAFTIYPCRGEYAEFAPASRHLVRGLVYPIPHPSGHGLGVHFTRTIHGAVTIGPTVCYQERRDDYEIRRLPLEAFLAPAQRLLPGLTLADLRPGGSGIRPKLHPPHETFADFLITRDARNGRLVQAAGIESPGLTASLAIGDMVAEQVRAVLADSGQ